MCSDQVGYGEPQPSGVPQLTIVDAIKQVLAGAGPLSGEEVYNRIVERRLYAFKALNPKAVVIGQLRRHCLGLDFPTASPVKYFRLVGESSYELESATGVRTSRLPASVPALSPLPEEAMEKAHQDHVLALAGELKEKILSNHPAFFERLVIDLLLAMGYGGSDPSLANHTGGPGDGGIDGIINEDKLGLGQIYVQAKRYAVEREVKRAEVQAFAGAMNKTRKGVFITTAKFAKNASEFASNHEKALKLIDGDLLCRLMIAYGVGVSEVKSYRLLRIDSDYFSGS